jgi:serine/threonine protein kinase
VQPKRHRGEAVGVGWADWKLEKFLGMGSFGEVWQGRNVGFHEPEAFKFFTQDGARDWLSREQQALNEVGRRLGKHPNIIEFKNVVIADQKWPFLVLEYIAGGSLEEWILSKPEDWTALNKQAIVEGVVTGLASAHRKGIFHRDLKPANVMLTAGLDIQAKIGDFGLGQVQTEDSPADAELRSQGMLVGTNMYLPPEALEPLAERRPAQDDVFALGVLWYQLEMERLERPPYDFADQLRQKGLHAHTIRLISRCLAHPERRFTDACALEDALKGVLPPETPWEVPEGCFDVSGLAREYLCSLAR